MEAMQIIVVTMLVVYLVLLFLFQLMYPKKNPHKMFAFWISIIVVSLLICGAFFLLVLYALRGGGIR